MNSLNRRPAGKGNRAYWGMGFRGGLLTGRDRGEPVSKFRRGALLTPEDRAQWDEAEGRRLRTTLGIHRVELDLQALREAIEDLQHEARMRDSRGKGPRPARGGMDLPAAEA